MLLKHQSFLFLRVLKNITYTRWHTRSPWSRTDASLRNQLTSVRLSHGIQYIFQANCKGTQAPPNKKEKNRYILVVSVKSGEIVVSENLNSVTEAPKSEYDKLAISGAEHF